MSFKRDGDNIELLDRLKHRRVNDLLGEHIPEDEAKLLSNGRLTCLICSYRPIFDNMKVLIIHRKGKKHTQELHKYLSHKQKLEFEESKRIQKETIAKEKQQNSQILGPKLPSIRQSKPILNQRNKVIDITQKNPASLSSDIRSDSSLVRKYLKDISKKTPLSHVVWQQKESYPRCQSNQLNAVKLDDQPVEPDKIPEEPIGQVKQTKTDEQAKQKSKDILSFHMSGWIRDIHGNLIRDPNAEFDSDDDS